MLLYFQTLVENAVLGILLGIAIALPILVLATMNVVTGLFATLNIICITVCVLGVIPLAGWKLDVRIGVKLMDTFFELFNFCRKNIKFI